MKIYNRFPKALHKSLDGPCSALYLKPVQGIMRFNVFCLLELIPGGHYVEYEVESGLQSL